MQKNEANDDHLRTYFIRFGRALNVAGLETELNLGRRTIRHWMAGERGINQNTRSKLLDWARLFGYNENVQYDQFL